MKNSGRFIFLFLVTFYLVLPSCGGGAPRLEKNVGEERLQIVKGESSDEKNVSADGLSFDSGVEPALRERSGESVQELPEQRGELVTRREVAGREFVPDFVAEAPAQGEEPTAVPEQQSVPDIRPPADRGVPPERAPDQAPPPCTTRITYGSAWLKPSGKTTSYDDVRGSVTWDGVCRIDRAGNGVATLSNGWKPVFKGRNCIIALDTRGSCATGKCSTRVGYGSTWMAAPNHPNYFDDVGGVVSWDGLCLASGSNSRAVLSNGWQPNFSGRGRCDLSFRYTQCGGLYANPVYGANCPDPGVLKDGKTYYMACTSGHYGYPIYSSSDLVSWRFRSRVFTSASNPGWASGTFWAPELHKVGARYVVYFSAKRRSNNTFAIGVAWSNSALGPYKDIGKPLVSEPAPGAIDAHYFRASNGKHYVLWKIDGNALGRSTPIKIQQLAADGLSLVGSPRTILQNTLSWEGALVEGAWMIEQGGFFYLFYSGNGYASPRYGVGVARSTSPLGPFQKASTPILTSKGAWSGPGHGSVVKGTSGEWVHVYHAWPAGKVGGSPGRLVLVDRIQWSNGWPLMRGAPSSPSQPLP